MNHSKRKFIAILLLATLGIYLLPKDIIHEFHSHEETIHIKCTEHQGPHFELLHTHCEALQVLAQPFFGHYFPDISIFKFFTENLLIVHSVFISLNNRISIPSRSPPILIF